MQLSSQPRSSDAFEQNGWRREPAAYPAACSWLRGTFAERYAGSVREDISDERDGVGWVRVTCDAPLCAASVEGRPRLGEDWPAGWAQDLRRKPLIPDDPRDYCPDHVALATA